MFITDRTITGTIDPFVIQANVDLFDNFNDNDSIELFSAVGATDATGDLLQGTVAAIWVPNAIFTEYPKEDSEGVLKHTISYQAHEDESIPDGDNELYLGFI